MNTFVYLVLLCLALFFPVRFHLHLHRIGQDDFFLLKMNFLKVFRWGYEVPFEKPIPWRGEERGEILSEQGPLLSEQRNDEVKVTGIMDLFSQFSQVYSALEKYGLGGTMFYLFLPEKYRHLITVVQRMEKKGRFTRFVWFSRLGFSDPALTGVSYGLAWDLKGVIMGLLQSGYKFVSQPRIKITPSFNTDEFETLLDCIFTIKLGHIIFAGFQGFIKNFHTKQAKTGGLEE